MNQDIQDLFIWVTNQKKSWKADYVKSIKSAWSDDQKASLIDEQLGAEHAFDEVLRKLKTMLPTES